MFFIQCMKGEGVVFGDDIILTVIEIRGDKVWLGVEHPKEVAVHKREVYEAIRSQDQERPMVTLETSEKGEG